VAVCFLAFGDTLPRKKETLRLDLALRYLKNTSVYLFLFAFSIRLVYNLTVAARYTPEHDSVQYQQIGFHLIYAHCFCLHFATPPYLPTIGRAPLWPTMIAVFSVFFGPGDLFVRLFLCVLDAFTCLFIYLILKKTGDRRLALLGGFFAALYPDLYVYTGWLYAETLYTFLLTALCYIVFLLQSQPRRYLLLLSGLVLGLLSLTRPNGLEIIAIFSIWLLVAGRRKKYSWSRVFAMVATVCVIACIFITPWTLRNYSVSGHFVPVASGDGTVLLGAYNDEMLNRPWNQITWIGPAQSAPQVAHTFPPYNTATARECDARCEVQRETTFKKTALQWIPDHITALPHILIAHFANMWIPEIYEADLPVDRFPTLLSSHIVLIMMRVLPIPVFLCAALSCVVLRRYWRELAFIYLTILFTIGQCIIFYGSPRMRAPIEPLLIILAITTIGKITQLFSTRRQHKVKMPASNI
jgi:4-amino-4-deoxy-L-arabinose transferase-like glycosyltransferase